MSHSHIEAVSVRLVAQDDRGALCAPLDSRLDESAAAFTQATEPPPAARETMRQQAGSLQGRRILVAEDGPDNQRLIRHILTRAGADVTIVCNGQDAIGAIEARPTGDRPFDLLVLDMHMPVLDGYNTARRLRDRGEGIPILALTAHALIGADAECLAAGCTAYMSKPMKPADLVRTCAALIAADGERELSPTAG